MYCNGTAVPDLPSVYLDLVTLNREVNYLYTNGATTTTALLFTVIVLSCGSLTHSCTDDLYATETALLLLHELSVLVG